MKRPWALVTGASDGIGVEFCRELAGRGHDLVLVARREGLLHEVADRVAREHGASTRVIPCDLAKPGAARDLHRRVVADGIEVDFLVNNAGLLFNGPFDEIDLGKQEDLLAVNVVALTALTHLFLRDMLARGRGRILNVASTAAWLGIPQQNVYAASKAYVVSFTLALEDEVRAKGRGVSVTALCPSYTRTKMLDNPEQGRKLSVPDALVLDPVQVAREGIDGALRGRAMVMPGVSNRVAMSLLQAFPRTWVTRLAGALYRRGQA
ncbi:MAG: SDR family NAD(P)-dependent oxidoreductase [Alphaproteobacteria bacterium]